MMTISVFVLSVLHALPVCCLTHYQALVKSAYQKNDFIISQPKNMLWVLKRTVSMRRFF